MTTRELATTFDPAAIEAYWYKRWEDGGLFRPDRPNAEAFTIVNPPPNVTGSLHIGHALDNTLQDIVIRYERLRGKDALWVVGTDHAGIATQMVVERQMEARGDKRANYSREDFIGKVWEWKEESGGTITQQLRRLGCSMDWNLNSKDGNGQFTMDEHFSRAVTKVFVDLYNKKDANGNPAPLIYRDKRLVNWDPALKTAISDLEVETRDTQGGFWRFRYPIVDSSTYIEVATTRPETMLADMAVAVHPDDERYADLVARGAKVRLPLTGREIPIVADEHADPELGSGAVKITPGHDFNDFDVGKRAGIAAGDMLNMLDADAKVCQTSDGLIPDELLGMDRFDARARVVEMLKEQGFLVPFIAKNKDGEEVAHDAEPRVIATPYGDRGGVVIEPWLTDQWYVDAKKLAAAPIAAVKSGEVEIVPKTWEKTFFNWMENIQPWCVSRQLWWGHRIPAWYGPRAFSDEEKLTSEFPDFSYSVGDDHEIEDSVNLNDKVWVAETEAQAVANAQKYYRDKLGEEREIILCDTKSEMWEVFFSDGFNTKKQILLWRDGDVLDTWFSSALWPFATLGWPDSPYQPVRPELVEGPSFASGAGVEEKGDASTSSARAEVGDFARAGVGAVTHTGNWSENPNRLSKHYPNNLLISGFDILFFWNARMMMMGHAMTGQNPWPRLYLHGLVRAPDGAKMSKSKGNVVDPLGLIDQFGADALRFFMAAMESQGRDIKMDESRVEGYRNFATKLWNATRFCQSNGIGASTTLAAPPAKMAVNQWIIGEVVQTLAELDKAMADLRFDAAASAIYQFAWNKFCDWYLELIKPVFMGDADSPAAQETREVAGWALDQIFVMLHPFMPFITEELWHAQGTRAYELILAKWPAPKASVDADAVAAIDWLIALTTATRGARNELGISPGAKLAAYCPAPSDLAKRVVERSAPAIERLARLVPVTFSDAPDGPVMQVTSGADVFLIPLEGVVDIDAEKARLTKARAAAEKEAKSLAGRLGNASFVEKAKPEAVDKARADLAHHSAEVERLDAALTRLV